MQGVSKRFGDAWAVRGIDLEVGEGERLVLIGPSGCGKTTTLRMMNRLEQASLGDIEVLGEHITDADPAALRRRIGYAIQEVGLFPHYTVRQNVAVVPELLGWARRRIDSRVDELLDMVGLPPAEHRDRYPRQLSGGQRQRVGIARALAADPPLVLLDEPFGALDPITREKLVEEFSALVRRLDTTFVLVTHDIEEAVRLGDRIAVMRDGRFVQLGTPADIVRRPADDFVKAMLGRRRRELRLHTTVLGELCELGKATRPPGAASIELDAALSLHDALDRLEQEGGDTAAVADGERTCFLSRSQLLEAVW
jgi:osmoprotectant transport system ATP-binding protein